MKTATCPIHGIYTLSPHTLPECPECIRARCVFPYGDDPKHAPTDAGTVTRFKSFRSDQISAGAIFAYMAYNDGTSPSGCNVYYSSKDQSFNAVSREPCGLIPGSGARNGSGFAAELAVLQDITGRSAKGPHFAYEEIPHFEMRVANMEWIEAPKCAACGEIYVYTAGTKCPACNINTEA